MLKNCLTYMSLYCHMIWLSVNILVEFATIESVFLCACSKKTQSKFKIALTSKNKTEFFVVKFRTYRDALDSLLSSWAAHSLDNENCYIFYFVRQSF